MTYKFKSDTLKLQAENVILACFEGDNEHAIIDASHDGTVAYHLVTVALDCDNICLNAEEFDNLPDACSAMGSWVACEYAGA